MKEISPRPLANDGVGGVGGGVEETKDDDDAGETGEKEVDEETKVIEETKEIDYLKDQIKLHVKKIAKLESHVKKLKVANKDKFAELERLKAAPKAAPASEVDAITDAETGRDIDEDSGCQSN